jgi:hypothetical protein
MAVSSNGRCDRRTFGDSVSGGCDCPLGTLPTDEGPAIQRWLDVEEMPCDRISNRARVRTDRVYSLEERDTELIFADFT